MYMDETYIHSSHAQKKGWVQQDETTPGLRIPVSKGSTLIILHAGGEMGFIPGSLTIRKFSQSTGDYHNEMNFNNYSKWLRERLLPNLPPRSVLVIDNAPYHNKQHLKVPNFNRPKNEMQEWLTKKNIPFSENMLKVELYNLIKLGKDNKKLCH